MNKKLLITLFSLVILFITALLISNKLNWNKATTPNSDQGLVSSSSLLIGDINDPSNNFGCPENLVPITLASSTGPSKIFCVKNEVSHNPDDYLVGDGTQTYNLKGYYAEHTVTYYGEDYDPAFDTPRTFVCKSFVVIGGNQDFITVYNSKIPKINGITYLNFRSDDLSSSTLSFSKILASSTKNNPIPISVKVWPLPERDLMPCEYYGIHLVN